MTRPEPGKAESARSSRSTMMCLNEVRSQLGRFQEGWLVARQGFEAVDDGLQDPGPTVIGEIESVRRRRSCPLADQV